MRRPSSTCAATCIGVSCPIAERFAPRAGLPQIEPVHGAALCRSLAFSVGAATRGEWRQLGAKSFARGRGPSNPARTWRCVVQAARVFCRSRAPRRMTPARCQKASPRGRGSYKSSPCIALRCAGRTLFLWEPRPAANGASSVAKASPRGRGSTNSTVRRSYKSYFASSQSTSGLAAPRGYNA